MIKNIFPKGYGILRWDLFSCVKAVPGIIRRKCFKSFPKTTKKNTFNPHHLEPQSNLNEYTTDLQSLAFTISFSA